MVLKFLSAYSLVNVTVYAASLPKTAEAITIIAREVPPNPITKYTTELGNCKAREPPRISTNSSVIFFSGLSIIRVVHPRHEETVFTKGVSEDAKKFANDPNNFLKTIWVICNSILHWFSQYTRPRGMDSVKSSKLYQF